jgi:F0F1-type ATP synthase membrane subunit a
MWLDSIVLFFGGFVLYLFGYLFERRPESNAVKVQNFFESYLMHMHHIESDNTGENDEHKAAD